MEIIDKVKSVLADVLHIEADAVTEDKSIVELGADSLDQVEIVMSLEDEYGVSIPDDDLPKIQTVKDIVDEIKKLAK